MIYSRQNNCNLCGLWRISPPPLLSAACCRNRTPANRLERQPQTGPVDFPVFGCKQVPTWPPETLRCSTVGFHQPRTGGSCCLPVVLSHLSDQFEGKRDENVWNPIRSHPGLFLLLGDNSNRLHKVVQESVCPWRFLMRVGAMLADCVCYLRARPHWHTFIIPTHRLDD